MRSQKTRHRGKHNRIGQRAHQPVYWCVLHRRSLSTNQERRRQCKSKNCPHLKPYRPPFRPLYSDELEEMRAKEAQEPRGAAPAGNINILHNNPGTGEAAT